jgi:hypothetical protein
MSEMTALNREDFAVAELVGCCEALVTFLQDEAGCPRTAAHVREKLDAVKRIFAERYNS